MTPEAVMRIVMEVMGRKWEWGVSDCTASACEVFRRLHGVDLMGRYRGAYSTARQARRLQGPDYAAFCYAQATRSGLVTKDEAEPGDIGLVEGRHGLSLAIAVSPQVWAGKTEGGFATTNAAVMIWGIPCRN
ncbi:MULTISPECIES: DUF6950 family protein [unclassified Haematobacter]|uniref:DUF6950 family protein n=1 Tax=unclassified Haematobacter TaxID=2640585 RepID=UPI0025C6238D|nr:MULTISPECIES: hypothetical protein [unclassified Haematobacter]